MEKCVGVGVTIEERPLGSRGVILRQVADALEERRAGVIVEEPAGKRFGAAGKAGHRRNVHDAALPPCEHRRTEVAAQQKGTEKIHVHDPLPLCGARRLGGRDQADAGIIHQSIRRAVLAGDPLRHVQNERLGGDISRQAVGVRTRAASMTNL